jgi:hypothetical protein
VLRTVMTTPTEIQTQAAKTLSPLAFHHERSDEEEGRARCKHDVADEISEEVMIHMVTEELRSDNEKTLEQALITLKKYIYGKDAMSGEAKKKAMEAFCQVGGHLAVVRVIDSNMLQIHGINVLWGAAFNSCQGHIFQYATDPRH